MFCESEMNCWLLEVDNELNERETNMRLILRSQTEEKR